MSRIIDKIEEKRAEGQPWVSLEFFPPKTEEGVQNLYARLGRMSALEPLFVDFTWGAGGSTSDLTLELSIEAKARYNLESNMHLTCTNMPKSKLTAALEGAKARGVRNIVALRGDPPAGEAVWHCAEGGFTCGLDLVKHIKAEYGDYFGISVAGYPEGHPSVIKKVEEGRVLSATERARIVNMPDGEYVCSDEDFAKEIAYLKLKVDAGAHLIITQLFYCPEVFFNFVSVCRAAGIKAPIVPGIMPVQSYGGFQRMIGFCKTHVPKKMAESLNAISTDEHAVKEFGIQHAISLCQSLIAGGVIGLHFYTLNTDHATNAVLSGLGLPAAERKTSPLAQADPGPVTVTEVPALATADPTPSVLPEPILV